MCYIAIVDLCEKHGSFLSQKLFDTERSGKMAGRRKRSADREEILEFLTAVMRNEELSDKDRMSAAFKLGRYLGLETGSADEDGSPRVLIYDGNQTDQL